MSMLFLLSCFASETAVLTPVVEGLPQITDIQPIPGHRQQLAVLTKTGTVHRVSLADGRATEWLNVPVRSDSEMGLLGIAFAQDFATTGQFFLHTNPADGEPRSQVTRWSTDPKELSAPVRRMTVLEQAQPQQGPRQVRLRCRRRLPQPRTERRFRPQAGCHPRRR